MGHKIVKRQDWYVSNNQLGAKFDTQYLLDNLKRGISLRLDDLSKYRLTKDKHRLLQNIVATCVIALTGARVTEALSLKVSDVKFEEDDDGCKWITFILPNIKSRKDNKHQKFPIKKVPHKINKSSRYYFLIDTFSLWWGILFKEIDAGIDNNQIKEKNIYDVPLFPNITRRSIYYFTTKFCKINPHGLRKIYAQELVVNQNLPIKVVQRLLGHRTLDTLEFYINLRTEDIKKNLKTMKDD